MRRFFLIFSLAMIVFCPAFAQEKIKGDLLEKFGSSYVITETNIYEYKPISISPGFSYTLLPNITPEEFLKIDDELELARLLQCKSLEGADCSTFKFIGQGYSRDKDHFYHGDHPKIAEIRRLEGKVDEATFTPLYVSYARDKDNLWYRNTLVSDMDMASFKHWGHGYISDNQHVWYDGNILSNADAATFKPADGVKNSGFFRDKNHVWHKGLPYLDADPASFVYLGTTFRKDKNYVYCGNAILAGADTGTFEVNPQRFYLAHDKNNKYEGCKIIKND